MTCERCTSPVHTTSWHNAASMAFDEAAAVDDGGFHKDAASLAKPRPTILPWVAICHMLDVMEHGAKKHGTDNWRAAAGNAEAIDKIVHAIGRHYLEYMLGQEIDTDSGLPVLAHLLTEVAFLLELEYPESPWTASFKERRK